MKLIAFTVCLASVLSVGISAKDDSIPIRGDPTKVHLYVLLVPDTTFQSLALNRARQDEEVEAAASVSEIGAHVGQILTGVLGGNVTSIFAGGLSFIPEADVSEGVSSILNSVAPTVSSIFRGWVNRFQAVLGITTVRPGTVLANSTRPTGSRRPGVAPQRIIAGLP